MNSGKSSRIALAAAAAMIFSTVSVAAHADEAKIKCRSEGGHPRTRALEHQSPLPFRLLRNATSSLLRGCPRNALSPRIS